MNIDDWCTQLAWPENGLLPAIAQDAQSGQILMLAWMNRDALRETVSGGLAVYWSRSRNKLWRKGEESGHEQRVVEIRLDCDSDTILLKVEQKGGIACHTGRASCFYRKLVNEDWSIAEPALRDPKEIYKN